MVHAGTQGRSASLSILATLSGSDLMPRVRHFADSAFFHAGRHLIYLPIDELRGARGMVVEGWSVTADQHAALSPCRPPHTTWLDVYAIDELTHHPDPLDPMLTEDDCTTLGLAA
ncbi:hypothetical protein B0T36_09875 [Nocardia donostiensis]|uniref:hypothetical protein n=1 Tax=Nocardia donostiensis TaxID=1538463 RepID=UPI0009DA3CA0|nr:hypothetical protein [Nocardia donostiensis]OQS15539.1 hypothetical protein B0T36_09875 [Nocardia donostiensis]